MVVKLILTKKSLLNIVKILIINIKFSTKQVKNIISLNLLMNIAQ